MTSVSFQSAPPAWGAIGHGRFWLIFSPSFNPRPPRGGRSVMVHIGKYKGKFQSAPPAWGAILIALYMLLA